MAKSIDDMNEAELRAELRRQQDDYEELRTAVLAAEADCRIPNSTAEKLAMDLRDARATIASQAEALAAKEAENERLTRNLADTNHEFRVMVLAYEDQEKELAAAAPALKAAREALAVALPQAEGCFANHYGDNPEGAAEPEHIRLMRAALTPKEPTR